MPVLAGRRLRLLTVNAGPRVSIAVIFVVPDPTCLVREPAKEFSVFFLDVVHRQLEAWAIHAFAVRQLKREYVQRATYHAIVGDQLGVHHGGLHVRAGPLNAAQPGFRLHDDDAFAFYAGAGWVFGVVDAKPADRLPGLFHHLPRFHVVRFRRSRRSFGPEHIDPLHRLVDPRHRLGRKGTLRGNIPKPINRERLFEPHQQQADLHGESLVEKRRIDRLQSVFQR